MHLYSKKDVDKKALKGARIAVLGFGSQGRAHALNMKDSGLDVVVGLRPGGPSWARATEDGFAVAEPAEAVRGADLVAVLTPDMVQPALYQESIEPNIKPGAALLFAHGFNVHFGQIKPRADIDVVLVAPKGPGALVRSEYERGRGVPCLYAVHQDATGHGEAKAKAYADGIGGGRALLIRPHETPAPDVAPPRASNQRVDTTASGVKQRRVRRRRDRREGRRAAGSRTQR